MATELERSSNAGRPGESFLLSSPTVSLPKGGGAIRGIGEKFAANPVTGTGSMTVPIATSPGPLRLRPAALALLRLGRRQRPVRLRLEPFPAVDHPQDRQGPAAVPRRGGVGRLHPLRRRRPGAGVSAGPDGLGRSIRASARPEGSGCATIGRLVVTKTNSTATASAATGRASRGSSRASSAGRKIGAPSDVHWRSISKDNILTLYGERRELAHRRSGGCQPHLQLADLRDARRQGQRRPLPLQGGGRRWASISARRTSATAGRGTTPAARPTATSSASATATARRCSIRRRACAPDS